MGRDLDNFGGEPPEHEDYKAGDADWWLETLKLWLPVFVTVVIFVWKIAQHGAPDDEERALMAAGDAWLVVLDESGVSVACGDRFIGDNFSRDRCLSLVSGLYESMPRPRRKLESRLFLSRMLPQHTDGARAWLKYTTRFGRQRYEETLVMAYQQGWKVDGYMIKPIE